MNSRIRFGLRSWSLIYLLTALAWCSHATGADLGVSESGRHITLRGKPFFWLGDTVWLLAQVPSSDELELYLRTRAEQGFTVIQLTAVMGEERVWGTTRATSRDDLPFNEADPARPAVTPGAAPSDPVQYDYWDHLDHVLERIHFYQMRPALVIYFVGWRGEGYRFLAPKNAYHYGRFLGERYRGKPEIIWILGGDNTPDNADKKAVWNLAAKGITEGLTGSEDYSKVLLTYHINGGASSSQIWHDTPWLDFNMAQTWSDYHAIYPAVLRDYNRAPVKPCGLGEGAYEDGPQYPTKPIDGLVIRKQAAWSYFAGGYHTYGNGNVWHFDTCKPELTQHWIEALRSNGAETLANLKRFLHEIDFAKHVPDQSLIAEGQGEGKNLNVALRSASGDGIAVYLSGPGTIQLQLQKITTAGELVARWVNPATGEERGGGPYQKQPTSFTAPAGWADALLHVTVNRK